MKDLKEKYARLKQLVIEAIGETYDLEKLKNYFKADIDSARTYRQIKTMTDLIVVLEQRDVLNHEYPMALFYIGEVLKKEDIKDKVKIYKKYYLDHPAKCRCGKELDYCPRTDESIQPEGNSFKTSSSNTDVMEAIEIVSKRREVVSYWRVVASELDIKENVIEEIYERHPKDKKMQAYEALRHWMERDKENATVERLDKALDARLCKVKGIGSFLRKPLDRLN